MKLPLWFCACLLAVECVMVLIFIPGQWTDRVIQQESALIKQQFGNDGHLWIEKQASTWFRASMIDLVFMLAYAALPCLTKHDHHLKGWKISHTLGLHG